MRLIIVEGTLDEVLTVMQRITRDGLVVPTNNTPETTDQPEGNGGGDGSDQTPPDKQQVAIALPLAVGRLSTRQQTILSLLMAGASNKQIARDLGIRESTVKSHVKGLLTKLGVVNRFQAALWGQINFKQQTEIANLAAPALLTYEPELEALPDRGCRLATNP